MSKLCFQVQENNLLQLLILFVCLLFCLWISSHSRDFPHMCQRTFVNSNVQIICNIGHTCVTSCPCPSWFTIKTRSRVYMADIVFAICWTPFVTAIPIHSGRFTAWNKQIQLRLFITSFNILLYYFYDSQHTCLHYNFSFITYRNVVF